MLPPSNHSVVCFGEILWDYLPTGAVPGGAPMNVAYHLKKLGEDPALITRIGLDEKGIELIGLMERSGISTEYFQLDQQLETGRVNASIGENDEVSYEIIEPVAWDNIQVTDELTALVEQSSFFVYGSLAARSQTNLKTLNDLRGVAKCKVLDINLRAPFYNKTIIEDLLRGVRLLKMNRSELELVSHWFNDYTNLVDCIQALQDKFKIQSIVVTQGAEGALFNHDGMLYKNKGYEVKVTDTIGSGDAFLAGLLYQLVHGSLPQQALNFASAMGAFVATQRGPCPDYSVENIQHLLKEKTNQNAI